jgi:1-deoxy-D-xylulose 5-phosphate reductoisomerase
VDGRIAFTGIADTVERALDHHGAVATAADSLGAILAAEADTIAFLEQRVPVAR